MLSEINLTSASPNRIASFCKEKYMSDSSRYEHPPYTSKSERSIYHVRLLQVIQLGLISDNVDVMISHDWPRGIGKFESFGCWV